MTLRLVGGRWKGRQLVRPGHARPSSARLREGLVSMLRHHPALPAGDITVMDLFAGSGAVGLDCASALAHTVIFVERDPDALAALKRNIDICCDDDVRLELIAGDVKTLPHDDNFDLPAPQVIFADPPYRDRDLSWLSHWYDSGRLRDCRLLVIQTAPKIEMNPPLNFQLHRQKRCGNALLHFFTKL